MDTKGNQKGHQKGHKDDTISALFEPPHDELAERAVLGGMIVEVERLGQVLEELTEEDFYFVDHRAMFTALKVLWEEKGELWEEISLHKVLERMGRADLKSLVYPLVQEAAVGSLLDEAVMRVKELSTLRKLSDAAFNLLRRIKDGSEVGELLELLERTVEEITKRKKEDLLTARELMKRVVELTDRLMSQERLVTGFPSGFLALDLFTTGLGEGDFVVVAARPGMGKSSFMLSVALHLALEEKVPVAIFSLEMNAIQLGIRAVSMRSGVPLQNLRRGFISQEDREKVVTSALEIAKASLYVDDTPALSLADLRLKLRRLVKEKGVKVVFVDYLQLLKTHVKGATRQEEVAEVSRTLKALAKELSIALVALAQLSRQVEHRSDKRPQLSDLRESGQIEQDADLVIFLHRPEYYKRNPPPEEVGIAEVIVAKQRQGPTGIVRLRFNKDTTAFLPLEDAPLPQQYQEEEEEYPDVDFDF